MTTAANSVRLEVEMIRVDILICLSRFLRKDQSTILVHDAVKVATKALVADMITAVSTAEIVIDATEEGKS